MNSCPKGSTDGHGQLTDLDLAAVAKSDRMQIPIAILQFHHGKVGMGVATHDCALGLGGVREYHGNFVGYANHSFHNVMVGNDVALLVPYEPGARTPDQIIRHAWNSPECSAGRVGNPYVYDRGKGLLVDTEEHVLESRHHLLRREWRRRPGPQCPSRRLRSASAPAEKACPSLGVWTDETGTAAVVGRAEDSAVGAAATVCGVLVGAGISVGAVSG